MSFCTSSNDICGATFGAMVKSKWLALKGPEGNTFYTAIGLGMHRI